MELITYNGQNTLPEQVSVNKANIEILKDEVEKLGFTLRGPYDASTEYAYNDVVEYQYCMYRVSDEEATALVGVVPTNTTYWQKITDSLRGPQGQQGIQGPQGPAGADGQNGQNGTNGTNGTNGKDALVYDYINDIVGNPQGRLLPLAIANFNRTPVENERLTIFMRDTASNDIYATNGSIVSLAPSYASYGVTTAYKVTGATGAAGPSALVYDRNIAFTRTADAEQLISVTLPFANFNRDPELNQDFVGILEDTSVSYIAQCEVQSISGENVTSIVANDINRITGQNGQNGQNGTNGVDGANGKDALTYFYAITVTADPTTSTTVSLSPSNLNRTPVVNDTLLLVFQNTLNNKSFICSCYISAVALPSVTARVAAVVETTGAAGSAPTLYNHTIRLYGSNTNTASMSVNCQIITSKNTVYSKTEFLDLLYNTIVKVAGTGFIKLTNNDIGIVGQISGVNSTSCSLYFLDITTGSPTAQTFTDTNITTFEDTVYLIQ